MNLKPLIASTTVATVVAGAALASAALGLFGPAEDDAVSIVPADAFVYGNVFLDPSAPQKLALKDLMAHFPEASTPEAAKASITGLLDEGLSEVGLTFADDIEPWLGSQVAFFVSPPSGMTEPSAATLIATDDAGATRAVVADVQSSSDTTTLDFASYEGSDYIVSADRTIAMGVVDDFLVTGNEKGFKDVVDASAGDSLEDSDTYQDAVEGLTEDRLATFYMDPSKAMAAMQMGMPGMMPGAAMFGTGGPSVGVVYARGDGLVIESSSAGFAEMLMPVGGTDLIERLPGDAWAAFGIPSFGATLEQMITAIAGSMPGAPPGAGTEMIEGALQAQFGISFRDDLLAWIGDVALFIQGSKEDSLGGGVVIEATDPAKAAAAMPKIEAALKRSGAPVKPLDIGGFEGFSLRDRSMPDAINFVLADQRVLIVFGRNATLAALGSDPSLAGMPGFADAQQSIGDDFEVTGYLDVPTVYALLRGFDDEAPDPQVDAFLKPLSFIVFGSHPDGERIVTRMVIGVR